MLDINPSKQVWNLHKKYSIALFGILSSLFFYESSSTKCLWCPTAGHDFFWNLKLAKNFPQKIDLSLVNFSVFVLAIQVDWLQKFLQSSSYLDDECADDGFVDFLLLNNLLNNAIILLKSSSLNHILVHLSPM